MHTHINTYGLSHANIKPKTRQERQSKQLSCGPEPNWPGPIKTGKRRLLEPWQMVSGQKTQRQRTIPGTNWAQPLVQSDLDLGSLLHLSKTVPQGIPLSCSLSYKVLEGPLQFIQQPQHLPVLLRRQVLGMLRDEELNIKGKCVQLRFPPGHTLFQVLSEMGKEEKGKEASNSP